MMLSSSANPTAPQIVRQRNSRNGSSKNVDTGPSGQRRHLLLQVLETRCEILHHLCMQIVEECVYCEIASLSIFQRCSGRYDRNS